MKFEDYKITLDLFQYGRYACSFDLKSGYHHVGIFPSHQRFLGFSWTFPVGRTRYFAYAVLPFGLSLAPYLFTKLMRPLVKYWRSRGLYCIVYLNDGFIMDSTLEKTQRASHLVWGDLVSSGFVVNQEKSIWCPVQSIVWLGIVWNFEHGTVAITDVRIGNIEQRLSLMLQKKLVSRRNWFVLEICAKASTRLYALRSLKHSKAPPKNIMSVYSAFIRPVLVYACQVWHFSIPQQLNNQIEHVQWQALQIALPHTAMDLKPWTYKHLTNVEKITAVNFIRIFSFRKIIN